ncbi:hypothetical protein ON010_g16659 [Phytophthora cinnamomi]|nr:hypothetical protein ON010_g16659 [Phytophthora cinnamomi]
MLGRAVAGRAKYETGCRDVDTGLLLYFTADYAGRGIGGPVYRDARPNQQPSYLAVGKEEDGGCVDKEWEVLSPAAAGGRGPARDRAAGRAAGPALPGADLAAAQLRLRLDGLGGRQAAARVAVDGHRHALQPHAAHHVGGGRARDGGAADRTETRAPHGPPVLRVVPAARPRARALRLRGEADHQATRGRGRRAQQVTGVETYLKKPFLGLHGTTRKRQTGQA